MEANLEGTTAMSGGSKRKLGRAQLCLPFASQMEF